MDTMKIERFARLARTNLIRRVASRLDAVLESGSPEAIEKIELNLCRIGRERLIRRTASRWFNRFCALRFMEVRGYLKETFAVDENRSRISSSYFEEITDGTELLLPHDLLPGDPALADIREVLSPRACENVEVLGWLYQFYSVEKKDEVFRDLRNDEKITPENIPVATRLFTPNWIVRYLVENSLGRLWILNRPNSALADRMDYYVRPERPEQDFLKIDSPEEIKLCDPACGAGHILVYAFDLLHAIYEEEGYDPATIPAHILTKNLYGIEIDDRAAELASFALAMKARERQKTFLEKKIGPNICVLKNVEFDRTEKESGVWRNLLDAAGEAKDRLSHDLALFREASHFGSLLRPRLTAEESRELPETLPRSGETPFERNTLEKCRLALRQSNALASRYDIVVANPPYMAARGMNATLCAWAKENYPETKSDLFSMFIERNCDLAVNGGMIAMVTMQNWMFLSSYERFRSFILDRKTILTLAHLGARAFDRIGGEVVSTAMFVLRNKYSPDFKGDYIRLVEENSETQKRAAIREATGQSGGGRLYRASAESFKKIPGRPIAYWIQGARLFDKGVLGDSFVSGGRNKTHDNDKYVRYFWEVPSDRTAWIRYANGGDSRKYAGNELHVVDWSERARRYYESHGGLCNEKFWNKEGITWSLVGTEKNTFRIKTAPVQYSSGSPTIFNDAFVCDKKALAYLNSPVSGYFLKAINPTLNTTINDVFALPYLIRSIPDQVESNIDDCIRVARSDWDDRETSQDFTESPLLRKECRGRNLATTYDTLRAQWQSKTDRMQRLEEENNRILIDVYGLQDELTPNVPLREITLTCNPYYRYAKERKRALNRKGLSVDDSLDDALLEKKLLADTMREFLSYAVGCMFGRYSPDEPGLILAGQEETLDDYLKRIPKPGFMPNENNVIPILDDDWFPGDITRRFGEFLRTTFGEEHYGENRRFLESALGEGIREYFVKDFYKDHVKRYRKRPIYWLFSSPKGSFNALVYMHRYRPDTASIVLNDCLRPFIAKLNSRIGSFEATGSKAAKELDKLRKTLKELTDWDREVLSPLSVRGVSLDLNDGVKANYARFGSALKKIPGV